MASRWFRFGDDADDIVGSSFQTRFSFYAAAMLGMPRNLLCLMHTNYPINPHPLSGNYYNVHFNANEPTSRMGSLAVQQDFFTYTNFVPFVPTNQVPPSDVCIYDPATPKDFQFDDLPLPAMQLYFARKLVALALEHHTKLVVLHFPTTVEFNMTNIPERQCWPEVLGTNVSLVGVPGAKLFEGLSDQQKFLLFANADHFNQNGQEFFTPIITPALIRLYETQVHHY